MMAISQFAVTKERLKNDDFSSSKILGPEILNRQPITIFITKYFGKVYFLAFS